MTEAEIASQLMTKVTPPPDNVPITIEPAGDINQGEAKIAPEAPLSELTQYKLQDYFGEQYKEGDEVKRQQVEYIYEQVSKMIDSQDYGFVVAKIRDLEQIIGTYNSEERLYKLYQWLKLENTRRSVEAEMGVLNENR